MTFHHRTGFSAIALFGSVALLFSACAPKEEAKPPESLPDLKLPKPDDTDKAEASKPAAKPQAVNSALRNMGSAAPTATHR